MLFDSISAKQKLSDNEIHLWRIIPQEVTEQSQLDSLKSLLSDIELKKVQRYRSEEARNRALITRAFVRSVLSRYTGLKAKNLIFDISEHGKPEISNTSLPLRFNISHNNNLIICAVCLVDDIGCDVESLSRKISSDSIAKRYYSVNEYQTLQTLSPNKQKALFFAYWTLKEAFVKATGKGISQGLDTFSFQIGSANKATFNDNIELSLLTQGEMKKNIEWYSCLNYLDQTHCIAICRHNKNSLKKMQIKYFKARDYFLTEFL